MTHWDDLINRQDVLAVISAVRNSFAGDHRALDAIYQSIARMPSESAIKTGDTVLVVPDSKKFFETYEDYEEFQEYMRKKKK